MGVDARVCVAMSVTVGGLVKRSLLANLSAAANCGATLSALAAGVMAAASPELDIKVIEIGRDVDWAAP